MLDSNLKCTLDSSSDTPVKKRAARTGQVARKSTGGKAPRKQLAIKALKNTKVSIATSTNSEPSPSDTQVSEPLGNL